MQDAMVEPLPKFDAPPVIETVIGVQFARLAGFSSAMAGRYWGRLSATEWPKSVDAPRLEDQFERFDEGGQWGLPGLRLMAGVGPQRTQIVSHDDQRMIQVQDSRFIFNWRRREGLYPSFAALEREFQDQFADFGAFVREQGLGEIEPNQWEVTYVNHEPRGPLWQTPEDWPRVLPGIYVPAVKGGDPDFETATGNWRYTLGGSRGRLHLAIQHGKTEQAEVLVLQLTTRGPIDTERGQALADGLALGHEAIVLSFAAMTSPEAHKHWKRMA